MRSLLNDNLWGDNLCLLFRICFRRIIMSSKLFLLARNSLLGNVSKCSIHSSSVLTAKVAVVLSGCGVYDGTEIHEASAVLVHLSRGGANVSVFAPDVNQMHTINHAKGQPMEPNRNVLVESARIARGNISALSILKANDYDAVVFPGGFGAAKNLSSFALDGPSMKVNQDVERVLKEFHGAGKPIGLCCIAPILAAKVIQGSEVTMGTSDQEAAKAVGSMGSKHVSTKVNESHVDQKNNIVTTAAFMCDATMHEIFDGIGKMINDVLKKVK